MCDANSETIQIPAIPYFKPGTPSYSKWVNTIDGRLMTKVISALSDEEQETYFFLKTYVRRVDAAVAEKIVGGGESVKKKKRESLRQFVWKGRRKCKGYEIKPTLETFKECGMYPSDDVLDMVRENGRDYWRRNNNNLVENAYEGDELVSQLLLASSTTTTTLKLLLPTATILDLNKFLTNDYGGSAHCVFPRIRNNNHEQQEEMVDQVTTTTSGRPPRRSSPPQRRRRRPSGQVKRPGWRSCCPRPHRRRPCGQVKRPGQHSLCRRLSLFFPDTP